MAVRAVRETGPAGPGPPRLSARELTGAPLISFAAGKGRRLRRREAGEAERARHQSGQPAPASYYLGQNLQYRQLLVDQGFTRLQDFYTNPAFNAPRQVNIICANV